MSKKQVDIKIRHAVATWSEDAPRGAVSAFCKQHNVSRAWFYRIRTAAAEVGPVKALEKKSPIPLRAPGATPLGMIELLLATRAHLLERGFDHGPLSVIAKLTRQGFNPPSRATVARIFTRAGVVVPEPRKRPRSSYIRFTYPQPNGCWQIDCTEWVLACGKKVGIFQLIDDHSRLALASLVATGETSQAAITVVTRAIESHGVPQKFLSDNGPALNPTRRGKRGALVDFLTSQGVEPITGRPGKPTTQGKNERFHQTLHKYLHRQPPAVTMAVLQKQIDVFDHYYNTERVHQALPPGMTPREAWDATPVAPAPTAAVPSARTSPDRHSARRVVGKDGRITILGIRFMMGKGYAGSTVNILHDEINILFFDASGVEIISHLKPPRGTLRVGNGKPAGLMADPAAAVRKRKRNPVRTNRPETSPPEPDNKCLQP